MAYFTFNNIRVSAIACAVPSKVVTTESYKDRFNDEDVDKFIKMTGITATRRTSEHQTASDLGVVAAKELLEKKGVSSDDIGAVVFGTHSPDYRRPASAFVIQKQLGIPTEAVVFDISLGCSAAVYGIQVVSSLMANSDINKALLIVGDTAGKTTNPMDRASIMLIGEASVAILIEKDEKAKPINSLLRSDGEGYRYLIVPGGGYRNLNASMNDEVCVDENTRNLHNSFMQGTSVFTFTISDVPRAIKDYLAKTETSIEDYDVLAFHQANGLILKQIAKKLKIPVEKMPLTLSKYGNTSGASPFVTLCDKYGNEEDRLLKVMVVGFGVGISWGVSSFEIKTNDILSILETDYFFKEGVINSVREL